EKLTGLKKEEVLNKRVLDIMPDLEKEWIVIYDTVARTGKSERFEMYSAPLKKYFEVAAYSPRKGQFACIFQDVTLKKYFEKEVIINDRLAALGQLSFGIAHEFNNILAIIKGNAQLLSMTCENLDEEQRELLKTIDEQVIRAADISGKMMNFSATRPAARKNENIVDVIKEIMIIQKNYLMMDNIELIFEIEKEKFSDDQDYMVFIDVNQIKLTLINMIMNARDAIIMKKNTDGIVKIILTKDEKNIIIKIQDNGIGMDEKMKEKLFTPFYTTKGAFLQDEELENIKGVGLNLLICWTIIKIHNGQIIVDSELNEGTTFTIKLPYYIKPINR
ncbi:MAG TPA: HAMP domain-containing sensor histidine kinase, partial [bacterium]|nr:HAMP domain-containing sensor histidine kinase [bacterium]